MDNINLNSSVSSESTGALEFKGSSEKFTEVYIIDYKIHDEDIESGYPLSGPRGSYLCSLLGAMSLLDRTRFASWQGQGADVVKQDILRSNPSVIIGLGSELMNLFMTTNRKVTDMSGTVSDITIDGHPFKYLVLPSPSYVLRKVDNPEVALRFSQDLYKAFQIVTKEYVNVLESKEVLSAHSFEEFKEIYESHFVNDSRIAYDIETNARPIYAEDSKIVGFSIGNKKSGVYVSLSALDFEMDPQDHDMIVDYLINCIFKEKDKLIIHNTMYERPYTLHCYKYEIGFDKADDTLVMSRLLKGSKEGAGLKYQAQKNLGYPDWETDLSTYISGFRGAVDRIVFGPKKYANLWGEIRDYTHNIFDVYHTKAYYDLSDDDREELMSIIDKLKSPMVDLYSDDEIENIGKLIVDKLVVVEGQGGILDSTIPYNWIPDRVLSKYGAIDSISTYDLCEYYEKVMDTDSTDKVDLHKGYRNWLEHMYVAYIMERNGLYFDDDVAERDKRFLTDQATRCLKSMIASPLFEPFILETCEWKYKPIILSDYLPDIATSQGFSVEYDRNTEKYIVKKDGKRVAKGRIDEIQVGASPEYMSLVKMMFKEEVEKAGSYEDLKHIYNPSSSTQSNIPRQILINDTLQMGGRITKLHTLAASPEFEKIIDQLPVVDQKFLKVACLLKDTDKLKELYGKEWAIKRKELFEGFCVMHRSLMSRVVTEEIKSILNDRCPVVIESFDDGGIIEIYNNLLVTGVDQDDESTWTPQFQWMINFRLYKKSQKIISSYIEGSVGRDSVVVVNKEDLSSGSHDISRKRRYTPNISSEETYLMAAKWSPNTAETGRWRSAIHTIPWGSQVKKYYTSRFLGGTTLAPDYSQMEVRTLAAISKDENMLELFRSGKDFHTETAKKIYRKDEVTAAERRFSKTATFSLLYGAMEESFARNYCNGDHDYAKMVYGGFFEAYPRVKEWVEERHREVQKDHRVSLELSGRFIPISSEGDSKGALNSMLRKSQNYPIQAQSADLTGCVIFDLQKYIEENNMKSLVIMYVHDSIEVDVYPYELIQLVDKLKVLLNESPMRRMGLPSKADVTLGMSLGHEIEMEDITYNEDFTEGVLTLNGYKDEIYDTVNNWKKAYSLVEISDESWKESFVSMGDLFILKKAYTPTLGTMRYTGSCKVHIKYYD